MAINELNPIGLITGYYEEEVEGLKPYEGIRQFTLLINYADYIYYIFEEIYITKPDGEGNTGDDEINENAYRLIISTVDSEGNNISGVELSIKIGQYNPIRLNMAQNSITYYNDLLIDGISVVVSGTKNNYSLIEEKTKIVSSKITEIRLEFNYTGTSNEENNVLKLGFKTNSIGTVVNVFVNNSASAFKTITLNTYSTTYINITNATSISYKATYNSPEGLEEKNGTVNVFSGTYVVTLSFSYNNNGEETPDTPGGNQSTDVSGITLNKSNLTLSPNNTFQFIATVLPANATNKSVYWAISFDGGNTYTEVGLEENYSPEYYNITFAGVGSGWTNGGSINFSGNTFSNSIKRNNNSSEATVQFKVNCNITDINNLYIYYPSESVNIKLSTESSWDSDGTYSLSKSNFGKTLDVKINQNTSSSSRELNIYASLEYNANWYGSLCRITQANSSSSSGGSGGNNSGQQTNVQTLTFDWGTLTGPFEYSQKTSSTANVLLRGRYLEELVVTMKINSTYSNSYYIERGIASQGSTFTNTPEGSNTEKTITFKLINAANGGTRVHYYITKNGMEHDASDTVQVGTGTCYINTIGDILFMCEEVWEDEYYLKLTSSNTSNTTTIINNESVKTISKTITYEETLININIDTNLPGVIYIKKYSGDGTAYFVLDGHSKNGAEITSDIGISYGTESFGIRIPRNDTSNEKNIILIVHKKFLNIDYEFCIEINQTTEAYENAEAKIIWGDYGEIDEYYDTIFYGDTVRNIQVKVQSNCDWEFYDPYMNNNVTILPNSGSAGITDITITTEAYASGVPKILTSSLYLVYNGYRDNDKKLDIIYKYQFAKNTNVNGNYSVQAGSSPLTILGRLTENIASNTNRSFNRMEFNTYYVIYSLTECSVYTNDSWLSIIGQSTFGIGIHTIKIHGEENTTGHSRTGTIYAKVTNNSRLNAEISISITQETNTSEALLEYRKIILNPSEDTVTFDMKYNLSGTIKEVKTFFATGNNQSSSLTSLTETGTFPGTKTITITMDPGLTAIAIYDSNNNYVTATYIERMKPWEVSYYDRLR